MTVPDPADRPVLDIARIVETLDRHGVEYLAVGGVAALTHGARRPTQDVDCLAGWRLENLERLAAAMRELNARLRSDRLTDAEAAALPVVLDGQMLANAPLTTWRTDAGDFDVLADIPDAAGRRMGYEELVQRGEVHVIEGVRIPVASLKDVIASKEFADRAKDREALPELRRLAAQRTADKARSFWPEAERPPDRGRPGFER